MLLQINLLLERCTIRRTEEYWYGDFLIDKRFIQQKVNGEICSKAILYKDERLEFTTYYLCRNSK